MADTPTAYPLAWPGGFPRTEPGRRESWKSNPAPTLATSLKEAQAQLRLFGATGVVLSSNVTLGAERPADPGVVAFFVWDKSQVAIPCDRWNTVAGNLRAIAKTIEAMRGIERWGAKAMIRAMFSGFTPLPSAGPGQRPWRDVLQVPRDASLAIAEAAWRARSRDAHPDRPGGSHDAMAALNVAIEQARKELGK